MPRTASLTRQVIWRSRVSRQSFSGLPIAEFCPRIVLHLGVLSMEKPLRACAASRSVPNATGSIDFLACHCASRRG